ncbi:MAG: hypothetical protein K8R59_17245 [Thermoanaerobaculales bacterium]|nr:hypothetical protein [Thermoanaerobaculales bacterium]
MESFTIILIKPSHYDDDGYVIQWVRSSMPSNTLAVLNGLAMDCAERKILRDTVDIQIHTLDETNTRIRPDQLARLIRRNGGRGLVGLVGVQTNQWPRAMDLARRFRRHDIPVIIGGFHISSSNVSEISPHSQGNRGRP